VDTTFPGREKIRVLQVITSVTFGGAEQIALNILRQYDRSLFHMDVCTVASSSGDHVHEAEELGATVHSCPLRQRYPGLSNRIYHPLRFWRDLYQLLRRERYEIVHSHMNLFSGLVMWIAHSAGVRVRITHSHTVLDGYQVWGPLYPRLMRYLIARHSTCGLGCARIAMPALFSTEWQRDPRYRVLYTGIDPGHFGNLSEREQVRTELGLPQDARVIGHVGSFGRPKGQAFLIDILFELVHIEPGVWLLFVGDGLLRPEVERKAAIHNLQGRVVFAGARRDIPRILSAMDAFAFPSLYEALPLAVLEAQAAGLRCVVSDFITPEVDVVPGAVVHLPLNLGPAVWANNLHEALALGRFDEATVRRFIETSPFSNQRSMCELQSIYLALAGKSGLKQIIVEQ